MSVVKLLNRCSRSLNGKSFTRSMKTLSKICLLLGDIGPFACFVERPLTVTFLNASIFSPYMLLRAVEINFESLFCV